MRLDIVECLCEYLDLVSTSPACLDIEHDAGVEYPPASISFPKFNYVVRDKSASFILDQFEEDWVASPLSLMVADMICLMSNCPCYF